MGKNLLFQKPVVSEFGLFYIIFRLICQKFGLFFETTGFETTGFSPYKVYHIGSPVASPRGLLAQDGEVADAVAHKPDLEARADIGDGVRLNSNSIL